jgi:hypothetical protein
MENLLIIIELKREVKFKSADGEEKVYIEQLGTFPIEDCSPLMGDYRIEVEEGEVQEHPLTLEGSNILCPEVHNGDLFKWGETWRKFRQKVEDTLRRRDRGEQAFWERDLSPIELAGKEALDKNRLLCSLHLFRRDDWRKFTLFENKTLECQDIDVTYPEHHDLLLLYVPEIRWGETDDPFAWNLAGCVARQKLESQSCVAMVSEVQLGFKVDLPAHHDEGEMTWLREVRKVGFSNVNWTDTEDRQVMALRKIDFHLHSVGMSWWSEYNSGSTDEPNIDTFLLLLEGLDWQ